MPLVRLQNVTTGQEIYASSFPQPANARGPAAQWRKQATENEIAMVNRLRDDTGSPSTSRRHEREGHLLCAG